MVVGYSVRSKRVIWLWNVLMLALVCVVVFFPYESSAQRAALGIGSKLKGGSGRSTTRAPRSRKATQGEQENDNNDSKATVFASLWTITTEKKGIVGTMIAILCGYIYLILQQSKIQELEKAIAGEERVVVQEDSIKAVEKMDLEFSGFQMELKPKKKNQSTRLLLDGSIHGRAQPGRMLAIMGPSGAGKSSVMHALAGKVKESSKLRLEGSRYINGHAITGDSQIPAAFVKQESTFFPHMTVRETLAFRVELKLGSLLSKTAQAERVEELIQELKLEKAADTIVGDAKVRGVSGGERKRLAIACELISSPSVIFLDEPTSGLDSTAATGLVSVLRSLADSGKTIVAVIHQPSQYVFSAFDDLLLVSEGKQMYFGETSKARQYMNKNVASAPAEMGTAEHILNCISRSELPGETPDDVSKRIEKLAALAQKQGINSGKVQGSSDVKKYSGDSNQSRASMFVSFVQRKKTVRTAISNPARPALAQKQGISLRKVQGSSDVKKYSGDSNQSRASIFVQFKLLLRRAIRENFRSKSTLIIKLVQQITLGVIYGTIYSLGDGQSSIMDRFGLISLIAIGGSNMAMASTVRSFPKEKAIVSGELADHMYGTLPYFIGKALSEIPLTAFFNSLFGVLVSSLTGLNNTLQKMKRFLGLVSLHGLAGQSAGLMIGAVAPSQDAALALFPAILVLNIIFDGRNISEENTPRFLRWLPKIGLIKWGFEGMSLNEFEGLEFSTSGPRRGPVAKTGDDALARFGLGGNSLSTVVKAQALIVSFSWLMSYLGLTLTRQKFQKMETPVNGDQQ